MSLEAAQSWLAFTLVAVIMLTSFFSLFLFYLVVVQTQNLWQNTTTNLRFSKYRKKMKLVEEDQQAQYVETLLEEQQQERSEFLTYHSL